MNNQEVELKFALACDVDMERIRSLMQDKGQVSEITKDKLCNTYFDNEDEAFAQNKAGLRIRKANDYTEMTLKVSKQQGASLHQRSEYNVPIYDDLELPALDRFPLEVQIFLQENNLMAKDLRAVSKICFVREYFTFTNETGTYEFAKDNGKIEIGNGSTPIFELEIEIKDFRGDEKDLYFTLRSIVKTLSKNHIPITIDPYSKLAKSMYLKSFLYLKARYDELDSCGDCVYRESKKRIIKEAIHLIKNRSISVLDHLFNVKESRDRRFIHACYDFENMLGIYRITHCNYYLTLCYLCIESIEQYADDFVQDCKSRMNDSKNHKLLLDEVKLAIAAYKKLKQGLDSIVHDNEGLIRGDEYSDIDFANRVFMATTEAKIACASLAIKSAIIYLDL